MLLLFKLKKLLIIKIDFFFYFFSHFPTCFQSFQKFLLRGLSILRTVLLNIHPFSPVKTTFHGELCNPIPRQAIELESCSNPLQIQQVL